MLQKSLKYYLRTIHLKLLGFLHDILKNTDAGYFKQLESTFFQCKSQNRPSKFLNLYYTFEFFANPEELSSHLHFENEIAYSRKDSNIQHCSYLFPAYYGLVCYNHFIKNRTEEYYKTAKKQLDYLIKHGIETEHGFFLYYTENIKKFYLKGKWYAGISQAEMLSLAIRIFLAEPDDKLKRIIHKLAYSLMLSSDEGGIQILTPEGHPWIEEYPGSKPSFVLNGFIFCVIALLEYEQVFPSDELRKFNDELLESLIQSLVHYKRGKYFKYSRLHPTLSNVEYQGVYVCQFKQLYLLTGNDAFRALFEETNKAMNWQAFYNFYGIKRDVTEISIRP